MRKISIAHRRLEVGHEVSFTKAELRARRRLCGMEGGNAIQLTQMDGHSNLAFPLTPSQVNLLDRLAPSVESHRFSGSLQRMPTGVFLLSLEVQESQESKLLSSHEVGKLLGVSRSTVYRMAGDGKLRALRIGRMLRFDQRELLRFLGNCQNKKVTV